jgi:hypothetical protein
MTQTILRGAAATAYRIDLPCQRTGFAPPPCGVRLKLLPAPGAGWAVLAQAAGPPGPLARWLAQHPGIGPVIAPGPAPGVLRATASRLSPAWGQVASYVKVHQLDLAPGGQASWFVEGLREQAVAVAHLLQARPEAPQAGVRCQPLRGTQNALVSRRQFEMLATAAAWGRYEAAPPLDLARLAERHGLPAAAAGDLLRRAEGAIVTEYLFQPQGLAILRQP